MGQQAGRPAKGSEFNWPVRVYYEDTDAGGVVFYANYLKYFERARTEWLRSLDVNQQSLAAADDIVFVVRSSNIDYLAPARLDDNLLITVSLGKIGRASIEFLQQAWRVQDDARHLLTTAQVKVVCVEKTSFRPHPIPEHILQKLTTDFR